MTIRWTNSSTVRATASAAGHIVLAAFAVLLPLHSANAQVSQTPLYLGSGNVPGNLLLVPSVEWPTINSVANLGDYSDGREFRGYFDPDKCYIYNYSSTESSRHFYPVSFTADHRCTGVGQWSGNFMNWAATQTIDPFRSVLTGGNRVRDTSTETWLEKARHDGQGGSGIYPNRRIPASGNDSSLVSGATPFSGNWMRMRIEGLGNKMRFRLESDDTNSGVGSYNPASSLANQPYEVSIRVAVCVAGLLEANCKQYSSGYKPEGLIQLYADDLRFSVFGYLNHSDMLRDGGVLRARQKFVGPTQIVPGTPGSVSNPAMEWNPTTGVLVQNPDATDAADTAYNYSTTVSNSGVINYLNKFGQMTNNNHKSFDPVSELYYTALRYIRDLPPVPEYSSMGGASSAERAQYVDGFPVITNWDDPLQYACQKNVLLGIGDVYTHRDKNLPGSSYSTDEPAKPALVTADTDVDVVEWTNRVGSLESLGNIGSTNDWSGRNNSAYLAGLAYFANTTDLRTDSSMPGKQTASTHWVDVLEALSLEAPVENQYWLATKWGGFDVPDDFDPATFTGPLDLTLWNTNGQTLVSFGGRANPVGYSFPKPDNYYLAGSANQMVDSLTTAFQNIADSLRSSASSVATNSTRLESSSAVYQAAFDSNRWSADLNAFNINTDGTIDSTPDWNAAAELDSLTTAEVDARNILTVMPPAAASGGSFLATTGVDFDWVQLSLTQQDALRQNGGTPVSALEGEARLEYLRGQRTLEQPSGPFRQRDSRLGDIVNSDPQFIHQQDFGYSLLAQSGAFTSAVSAAYTTYRQTTAYQNRPPLVLVGANDGMLHGFDASSGSAGGSELFAFIPYSVFDNLYELTDPDYEHRYFVDGSPRAADAYLGATLGWRTIVVGGTGAGGRSIFALDISAPSSMNDSDVLWEFSHPDLGNTIGQPAIAPLPNGEFGVIVTDGYLGDTTGHIWILDPADGSITASFTLPNAGDFGAPLVSDLNGDRVADRIYVGDTLGQLWRIDLVGSNTSNWGVPSSLVSGTTLEPLFIAQDPSGQPQPITGALASAFTEEGDHAIFFGTGTFYQVADNVVPVNPRTESFYGVFDRGTQVVGRSSLTEQEILTEQDVDDLRVRAVTQNYLPPADDGWYLDLVWKSAYSGPGPAGERVVSRPLVRDDRVIFTTLIPNPDPCSPGGESWLMELNTSSGGRLEYAVFDLGDDGNFDSDDWITVTLPDGTDVTVPPSALAPGIGIVDSAAVVSGVGPDQDEIKILSGSSGDLIRISERGGVNIGRQSWRQRN